MTLLPIGFLVLAGCSPDGHCWPEFTLDRPALVREVDSPAALFHRPLLAATISWSGPVCQPFLPKTLTLAQRKAGWTYELLLAHELSHCKFGPAHQGATK